MSLTGYPLKYTELANQATKRLNVVLEIEGAPDLLSIVPVYSKIRYGDPINYADAGLAYGGYRLLSNVKSYMMVDGGLTITQKIEPEQGRGSISQISLTFLDKDGYMTALISPGIVLDELLGNKLCVLRVGYVNSSYPEDYLTTFRGFVTKTTAGQGTVKLEFSDANVKRRQQFFSYTKTQLAGSITSSDTSVPVDNAAGLVSAITGPDGTYDPNIKTYLKIGDEYMRYLPGGISGNTVTVTRGDRGTIAVSHSVNDGVENAVEISGHPIDVALKLSLSGWNGPYLSGVAPIAIGTTLDPLDTRTNVILLRQDADKVYGLSEGDWVTVSGSVAGNDGSYQIQSIENALGDDNRMLVLTTNVNYENGGPALLALRSQYDTFPTLLGVKNSPREIDVKTHKTIRNQFLGSSIYMIRLLFDSPQSSAKEVIESQCFLPIGVYALTRYGRLSVGFTKPPIADDKLLYLNSYTILDPQNIRVERATNNRRFYNVVTYQYDKQDNGAYRLSYNVIDTESLTKTAIVQALPIKSDGLKAADGATSVVQQRGSFLLNRFKRGAYEIPLKVNWQLGGLIEVGDTVVLQDNGELQIANLETGKRNIGEQLFEVIQRSLNIREGNVSLTLLSSLGYSLDDRYAVVSPSSLTGSGSTVDNVVIVPSFGQVYGNAEERKWTRFVGEKIRIHSKDYTYDHEVTLVGFDPTNPKVLLVSPSLPSAPLSGYVIDIANYSNTAGEQKAYKTLYTHIDPTLTVVSGTSQTVFDVSLSDAAKLVVGFPVRIHNKTYSIHSPESKVVSVVGTTVTVQTALGFTPSSGQYVELVGFQDGGGPYRFL